MSSIDIERVRESNAGGRVPRKPELEGQQDIRKQTDTDLRFSQGGTSQKKKSKKGGVVDHVRARPSGWFLNQDHPTRTSFLTTSRARRL